jgi:signal transduction histidine kinase/ActR/RegA family two-component response regulator
VLSEAGAVDDRDRDLAQALIWLNGFVGRFRHTAVYKYRADDQLHSVAFDRGIGSPALAVLVPNNSAYCDLVRTAGRHVLFVDATTDDRVPADHVARASVRGYCGVPIFDGAGGTLGILCHFDPNAGELDARAVDVLETAACVIAESYAQDRTAPLLDLLAAAVEQNRACDARVQLLQARNEELSRQLAAVNASTVDARSAIETAAASRESFIARVSHELRNPLASILGWASRLREGQTEVELVSKGVEVIERNAKVQLQVLDDLLDVAESATARLAISPMVVDVGSAIVAALDPVTFAASAKGLTLVHEIDAEVGTIIADPDRFQQILGNLVANAVRFTPKSGTVAVRATREDSELRLDIIDTGSGIESELLPYALEAFRPRGAGIERLVGVGLAATRALVELHGGTISVASDGPVGVTVTVRFPSASVVHRAQSETPPVPAQATAAATGSIVDMLRETVVFVVDDDDDAREVIAAMIARAGATVRQFSSGSEALHAMESERVDVLVSDIDMPGMDGLTFIRIVRTLDDGTRRRIPAVAVTAQARSKNRRDALAAGFDEHLAKPVDAYELVRAVGAVLGRR